MAVTNLTGYTWVANEYIDLLSIDDDVYYDLLIEDIEGGAEDFQLFVDIVDHYYVLLFPNNISDDGATTYTFNLAYYEGTWDNGEGKIHILGGTDATNANLILWLEDNGTLTPPASAGYEVTFVTNGGTSVTKLEDVEELPTPLPTTTKSNNIFVGWFYDSGFEVQAFSGDTISSNITLYAKWYANMEDFYKDVADAIRSKNGGTEPIKHTDFAYKIRGL